jgi:hypothetical protein
MATGYFKAIGQPAENAIGISELHWANELIIIIIHHHYYSESIQSTDTPALGKVFVKGHYKV